MKNFSAFDIIGPRMVGPSSSHTAGAARIGKIASKICNEQITKAVFYLHGSFAKTYKGHGTDRALTAGIMGMDPDDDRLCQSMEIAKDKGIVIEFVEADFGDKHPNTVKIVMTGKSGKQTQVTGSSIGGGNIVICEIDGLGLEFTGEYQTLIIRQHDKPGVTAEVTKIISEFSINIAFMRVFRHSKGEDAFMIIETDNKIPQEVVTRIQALSNEVLDVHLINVM